ncbi:MAG: hypothetical protein ABSB19_00340 [Methylomonas sp.]|jgi:hypothetical protein
MQKVKRRAGVTRINQGLTLYLTEGQNLKAICLIGDEAQIRKGVEESRENLDTIAAMLGD